MQVGVAGSLIFIPKKYFEINLFKDNKTDDENQDAATDADVTIFKYRYVDKKEESFWKDFCTLMKYKVYLISTGAVTILLFIVTAITFWITDYLRFVMEIEESVVTVLFVITCVTAPSIGIIVGGCYVQRLGGYETKVASLFVFICSLISAVCSIAIPLFNNIIAFTIFLWLFLFFGAAIVPNIIGIYISSLPIELRGSGSSVSNTLINAVGYLPAPYIYGAIYTATKEYDKKIALTVILATCWLGSIFLAFSMYFRNKLFDERKLERIEPESKNKEIEISVNIVKELELVDNV
jgi:MFS family permease